MQKLCDIMHSYTLELGYHQNNYVYDLPYVSNTHRKNGNYGYIEDECENYNTEMYKRGPPLYTIQIFEQVGKAVLISLLDLFEKNPYSR